MRTIGALTPCLDEEATIVFTVASLLPYVDYYVIVDSGSTDKTLPLLYKFFQKEIDEGKLNVIEYGPLPDYDISKPKNKALDAIKKRGCEFFIHINADDIFFDDGAKKTVQYAHTIDINTTLFCVNQWELYQYRHLDTLSWLAAIQQDLSGHIDVENPNFMCSRIPPGGDSREHMRPKRYNGSYGHARIFKTDGAVSQGKWTDEAQGMVGEGIVHPNLPRVCIGDTSEYLVHYGWARPMRKKIGKSIVWTGQDQHFDDPRINRLHKEWPYIKKYNVTNQDYGDYCWPHNIIFPFNKHPEAVQNNIVEVINFLNEH